MIFFNEEIIVLFGEEILPAYQFSLTHLVKEVVIEVGSAFNEAQFGLVAVHHPSVEFPLQ